MLKKTVLGSVVALATVALMAPVAAAHRPLIANSSMVSSDYTGVEVGCDGNAPAGAYPSGTPCEFDAHTNPLVIYAGATPLFACDITLHVKAWRDGETEVTVTDITGSGGTCEHLTFNYNNTEIVDPPTAYDDQICHDAVTGADEDIIEMSLSLGAANIPPAGSGYVRAGVVSTSGVFTILALNSPIWDGTGTWVGESLVAPFGFTVTPHPDADIAVTPTEDPCPWEFAS